MVNIKPEELALISFFPLNFFLENNLCKNKNLSYKYGFNIKHALINMKINFLRKFSLIYEQVYESFIKINGITEKQAKKSSLIFNSQLEIKLNLRKKLKPLFLVNKFSNLILVNEFKDYTEVLISYLPKDKVKWDELNLDYLPKWMISSFKFLKKLNQFQLRIFPFILGSDSNLLIGAPTGCGKTVLVFFSILRIVINSTRLKLFNCKVSSSLVKILYIAPTKALVKEVIKSIQNYFSQFGFAIQEITGDTIINYNQLNVCNFMVGTPEKIEILLNNQDKVMSLEKLKLLIVDEVHFLREERGFLLENLLMYFIKNFSIKKKFLRIISLSATIPNFKDIGKFLNVNLLNGLFYFGPLIRENILNRTIIGIKKKKNGRLCDSIILNSILMKKISYILNTSFKPKIMIFVQSRIDTYNTGILLHDLLSENEICASTDSFSFFFNKIKIKFSTTIKKLLNVGIGIHHSGLSRKEKIFTEKFFEAGKLKFLITTTTLAWGINLNPSHVIIKGTKTYSVQKGSWVEISGTNIVQMLGRAGRFSGNKENMGFLITMSKNITRYIKLIKNQTPIESNLLGALPDSLNIEFASRRIGTLSDALQWFAETFFWVRIERLLNKKMKINNILNLKEFKSVLKSFFISQALNELASSGLIKFKLSDNFVSTTIYGKICAFYHVNYQIFLEIISKLSPNINLCQLLNLISCSREFSPFLPRKNEKPELLRLSKLVMIPIQSSFGKSSFKVNTLVQSYIESIRIKNDSLQSDCVQICKSFLKLSRAMFEISLIKKWASTSQLCFDLYTAIKNRGWCNQKDAWKSMNSLIEKKYLNQIKKRNISFLCIQNLKNKEIELLMNSKKGLKLILEFISLFPIVNLDFTLQPISRFTVKFELFLNFSLFNSNYFKKRHTGVWLFIEDAICDTIIFAKYLGFTNLANEKNFNYTIILPIFDNPVIPYYKIQLKFDTNPILNTEYIIDLTKIVYPMNYSIQNIDSFVFNLPISRLFIGFKGGNSIREYFLSHIVKLNSYFSEQVNLIFKAGQDKIFGLSEQKKKTILNEFNIMNSFLTKKRIKIFFSNNGRESSKLKILQFKKNSNCILGIPIESNFIKYINENKNFKNKKKIFFLKNLEIFSVLKNSIFFGNKNLSLILEYGESNQNLELEASLELIIETILTSKNIKKFSSMLLLLPNISNLNDIIDLFKSDNLFKGCPTNKFQVRKPLPTKLKYNTSPKNPQLIDCNKNYDYVNQLNSKKKNVIFFSKFYNSIKKITQFILRSGILFKLEFNKITNEKFINFYISNHGKMSKSQKFFLAIGLGLHSINFKFPNRKIIEEFFLTGFYSKFFIQISSLSKISKEKFHCEIGFLDQSIFLEEHFRFFYHFLKFLVENCRKISFGNKKYLSSKISVCSVNLPIESSWKKFFVEKGVNSINSEQPRTFLKTKRHFFLNFFLLRLRRNPNFYLSYLGLYKKIKTKNILLSLLSKLKKKRLLFLKKNKVCQKTLKGIIMSKHFYLESKINRLFKKAFMKVLPYSSLRINVKLDILFMVKSSLSLFSDQNINLLKNKISNIPKAYLPSEGFLIVFSKKKETIHHLCAYIDILYLSGHHNYILATMEKIKKILSKDIKFKSIFLKKFKNNKLAIFLMRKIHEISNFGTILQTSLPSNKKSKMAKLPHLFKQINYNVFRWEISFSFLKKAHLIIVELLLMPIFSCNPGNDTNEAITKYNKCFFCWIIIYEKVSDNILGKFRLNNNFSTNLRIKLLLNNQINGIKIYIFNEKLLETDGEFSIDFC